MRYTPDEECPYCGAWGAVLCDFQPGRSEYILSSFLPGLTKVDSAGQLNVMRFTLGYILGLAAVVQAQEIFVTTTGYKARPQCKHATASPSYLFQPFSYTLSETVRYAISMPSPTTTKTYAPAFTDASKHMTSVSTTTWGSWVPGQTVISATDTQDPYGQAAWSSMWKQADLQNYVRYTLPQLILLQRLMSRPDHHWVVHHHRQPHSRSYQRASPAAAGLLWSIGLL